MISSILIGLVAAFVAAIPVGLHFYFKSAAWFSPIWILGVTGLALVWQRFLLDQKPGPRVYDGLADLFIHIHSSSSPDSAFRWMIRGCISFLLALTGTSVGLEGAAIEISHAFVMQTRARSARWFEQKRRTDAASALAAGIAAVFHAPFAAILLPMELGMGGRGISVVVASLSAFIFGRFFSGLTHLPLTDLPGAFYNFRDFEPRQVLCVAVIGLAGGLLGAFVVRFIRYFQESLLELFQTETWMRILGGGVLLFLVALVYRAGHQNAWEYFEQVLWGKRAATEFPILFVVQLMGLALVLSAFGTLGFFWPMLALGATFGSVINHYLFSDLASFGAVAAVVGGVALWASVLDLPIAATVLAFEITQNFHLLIPCFLVGLLAKWVRVKLKTRPLFEKDLEARGVSLIDGRSASLLNSVFVKDAMVIDHENVHEHEPISELYGRVRKSRYPFLPVVNAQGNFLGLLTIDMVQEAWQKDAFDRKKSPLSQLLEAKDLIYRAGTKTPSVRANDKLSATRGLFENTPCVPVVGDDKRVLGLLFVYNVRLAYDREVAKRSLSFEDREA